VIGTSSALAGAVLLLMLILVWIRADLKSRHLPSIPEELLPENGDALEVCPPEYVSRIFSNSDLAFVSELESQPLKKQFLRERSAVALLWVSQTTSAIQGTMRRHLEASRRSRDIEITAELRILLQYAQLRFICGALFLLIELAGPHRLQGMALRADKLTQRIGGILAEFESGNRAPELDGERSS